VKQTRPLPAGWTLHCFPSLASTNDEALRRALAGAPHGTAILAARQEAGRGRRGRSWHSPAGGLYLSVILRPDLAPERQRYLPLALGLALRETLAESTGLNIGLKWPNDIQWQGAKLAGILVENVPGRPQAGSGFAVGGLGVNLAGDPTNLSRSLGRPVTSLTALSGREWQKMDLIPSLLCQIDVWYQRLALEGPQALLPVWRRHDTCRGQELLWHQPNGSTIAGQALGLDDSGAYIIRSADGASIQVLAGDLLAPDAVPETSETSTK